MDTLHTCAFNKSWTCLKIHMTYAESHGKKYRHTVENSGSSIQVALFLIMFLFGYFGIFEFDIAHWYLEWKSEISKPLQNGKKIIKYSFELSGTAILARIQKKNNQFIKHSEFFFFRALICHIFLLSVGVCVTERLFSSLTYIHFADNAKWILSPFYLSFFLFFFTFVLIFFTTVSIIVCSFAYFVNYLFTSN